MILGYLFRNKVLLVLIIIAAGIFFVSSKINSNNPQALEVQQYQVIAPSYDLASKVIATPSRIYYARTMEETESEVILLVWYDYNEKQWQKHDTPLPLDKNYIKIYDRRKVQ